MSIAFVAQQNIGSDVGNVEIGAAVVVVVSRRHPHAVAAVAGAALGGDVVEAAIAPVAIEPVAGTGALPGFQPPPLHQVGVQVAVAVHVEEGGAPCHYLGHQVAASVAGFEGEADSAVGCGVPEPGGPGWGISSPHVPVLPAAAKNQREDGAPQGQPLANGTHP